MGSIICVFLAREKFAMKHLYRRAGIALVLATSLLLGSCLTVDADPEPAALDQAVYEESSMSFSQAEEAVIETTAEEKGIPGVEFDPSCDDACFPGACRACLLGCIHDFEGQPEQQEDCLNVCSFCGHPCFC
jgi:hypothetical protein